MKKGKKIFVNVYLAFNLGDDLFLDILAKKFPDCEFTVNYLGNKYDYFLSSYSNVKRRQYTIYNKILQRLNITDSIGNYGKIAEEYDALILLGGSLFREEEYHHSLYEIRMRAVKEFKSRGKSVFILGANFGPFRSEQFFQDYEKFFKLCDDICFRDRYSYELFKHLSNVRYAPDIVFQLNVDEYKTTPKEKRVGFSVIDVRHKYKLSNYFNGYITSTVKTIEQLVKKGYECCLMSFCEQEGDLSTILTIQSCLSPQILKNVYIYNYKGSITEALELISSFEMFIAARFHANILALLLDVGVMPIIYSDKTINMLKDIKLDQFLVNMDRIHLQHDEEYLNRAFYNKANLEVFSNEARNHFEKLDHFLGIDSHILEEV